MRKVRLENGELLKDRLLVIELCSARRNPYLWIGCSEKDPQGQHCVATITLAKLRKILPMRRRAKRVTNV